MFDHKTTDYCAVCGESPESASHGPFSNSHEYHSPHVTRLSNIVYQCVLDTFDTMGLPRAKSLSEAEIIAEDITNRFESKLRGE